MNANSKRKIVLYGRLLPKVYSTPDGEGYSMCERYQLFYIENWIIERPFKIMNWKDNIPLNEMIYTEANELEEIHFENFPEKATYDYSKHF